MDEQSQRLTARDREVIEQCLRAAVYASWFEEPEFATLFGASRSEVQDVLTHWPHGPWHDYEVRDLAVNNALLHVVSYPHGASKDEWHSWISAAQTEVNEALDRWRGEGDSPSR